MNNNLPNTDRSSSPRILTIPKEILHRILSFTNPYEGPFRILSRTIPSEVRKYPFVKYRSTDGRKYYTSEILVLRQVCKDFRRMVPHLDFWYLEEFNFTRLVEFRRNRSERSQIGPFLSVLFNDADFADALGRRKVEWSFESLEEVRGVIEGIPLFKQNARTICLKWSSMDKDDFSEILKIETEIDVAIDLLSECKQITKFSAEAAHVVPLSKITSSFPHLEILSCPETDHFDGSLSELRHLKTLYMDINPEFDSSAWTAKPFQPSPWLPIQSSESLTDLTLTYIPRQEFLGASATFFDIPSLHQFTNLTSLYVTPLSPPLVSFLQQTPCHLQKFGTDLWRSFVPISLARETFTAPCLQTVRQFSLSNKWYDEDKADSEDELDFPAISQYWSLVFDAFTWSLSDCVEDLHLNVPLHVECCAFLTRMVKLKSVDWDGSDYPYFGMGSGENAEEMESALAKAFAGFKEKPRFAVEPKMRAKRFGLQLASGSPLPIHVSVW